jgi:DNA-directed RNA polymerase subunit H (RpoH/RPB5)
MSSEIRDLRLNPQKRNKIILERCIEMLTRRKLLQDKELINNKKHVVDSYDEINHLCDFSNSDLNCKIRIIGEKVTTLNKINGLYQLLDNNQDTLLIIIVHDIQLKPFKEILEFPNTEVFWIHEFIIDPINHHFTPEHRKLEPEEKDMFISEYKTKLKDLPRIDKTDFVVRYYNFKVGDYIEIKRNSISSGIAIAYRVVVNCSLDKLFAK